MDPQQIFRGDTVNLTGVVTLPTGAWYARCGFNGPRGEMLRLGATLALIGVNANDATKSDYALTVTASSSDTSEWPIGASAGTLGGVYADVILCLINPGPPAASKSSLFARFYICPGVQ